MDAKKIVAGLQRQRERQSPFCDVRLQAEGEEFAAHKSLLAAVSPYFEAMFTGTFKESTDNPVVLTSISNVGLRVVLDVIYTSSVNLTVDNVVQVLPTAHLLQLMEIVHQCADFMTLNISLENCLSFLQLAEKYDLEHCARAVDHYLINNFMEVANTAGFLELSKDSVCRYLADDGLMINGDELAAFRCAKKWLEAQPERTNEVYDVMKCVRFPKMPVSVLMDEILKDTLIDGNTVCRDLVMDAVRFHTNLYTQPLKTGPQYKPRGEIGLLLVGPGRRINSLFYTVEERPTELYLASFPEMRNLRSSYLETPFIVESLCSVQYGNFLFLFGVDGRSNCAVSWRYDASSDHWASIAGVPREAAVGCAAAAVNKQIILVGGMTIDKRSLYDIIPSNFQRTAYIYSIEENSWNPVADMPERLAYMAMTSVNDTAFCAGGITQGQSDSVVVDGSNSNLLHSYDVCSNTWTRLACMLNERSHFCLEAVREKLYAIGGYQMKTNYKMASAVLCVDCYDIARDQWTVFCSPKLTSVTAATSHVLGDAIYILGGERPAVDGFSSSKISCFNTEDNKFQTSHRHEIPKRCSRHASGLLILPKLKL